MEGLWSDDSVQWLAIQAAYSQQNCDRGTANSDAFVVSAVASVELEQHLQRENSDQ